MNTPGDARPWILLKGRSPTSRVQAAAQAAIPFCDDQTARFGSFTPHLSVGQFGSREEVEAFLSGQAWESAMLRVEEVCLMRRTGAENPFEVIWRVPLGKRGPPTRAQVVVRVCSTAWNVHPLGP